jgi:hypothetical protein
MFKRFLIRLGWVVYKHEIILFAIAFLSLIVPILMFIEKSALNAFISSILCFGIVTLTLKRYSSRKHNWRVAVDEAEKKFKYNARVKYLMSETRKTKNPFAINKLMNLLEELERSEARIKELASALSLSTAEINTQKKRAEALGELISQYRYQ